LKPTHRPEGFSLLLFVLNGDAPHYFNELRLIARPSSNVLKALTELSLDCFRLRGEFECLELECGQQ
jgi:hypothetical protein